MSIEALTEAQQAPFCMWVTTNDDLHWTTELKALKVDPGADTWSHPSDPRFQGIAFELFPIFLKQRLILEASTTTLEADLTSYDIDILRLPTRKVSTKCGKRHHYLAYIVEVQMEWNKTKCYIKFSLPSGRNGKTTAHKVQLKAHRTGSQTSPEDVKFNTSRYRH